MIASIGSKEFLAGMTFNVKVSAHNFESLTDDVTIITCRIHQIWNAVAQINPAWPITRAVHIVGGGLFGFFPVTKDDDGRESFNLNIGGLNVTIYAPDLFIPGVEQ